MDLKQLLMEYRSPIKYLYVLPTTDDYIDRILTDWNI